MCPLFADVTGVLMAKRPRRGLVKTRLYRRGPYTAEVAAEVAWEMLHCTARRLAECGRLVLAVTPDGCGPEMARRLDIPLVRTVDQGAGDLGQRLSRVWRLVGTDRLVAFFGGDAPDVPEVALGEIAPALGKTALAIGSTGDGGFWTLAGRSYQAAVFRGIDWGTSRVYDQTCQRAAAAALRVHQLPAWHDIDRPEDVQALRQRLRNRAGHDLSGLIDDAPLRRLAERLDALCSTNPLPRDLPI